MSQQNQKQTYKKLNEGQNPYSRNLSVPYQLNKNQNLIPQPSQHIPHQQKIQRLTQNQQVHQQVISKVNQSPNLNFQPPKYQQNHNRQVNTRFITNQAQAVGQTGNEIVQIQQQAQKTRCNVCLLEIIIVNNPSKFCTHKKQICDTCIKEYFQQQINQKGQVKNIKCPYNGCSQYLDSERLSSLLDPKYKLIQETLELKGFLEQQQEFRWCSNPKGCGNGQFVDNYEDLQGYYCCNECKIELCFKHRIPFHFSFTCEEYNQELEVNERASSDFYILQNTKKCPGCRNTIEKHSGCSVMICCQYGTHGCQENMKSQNKCDHGGQAFCGTMFCWHCLSLFKNSQRTCQQSCKFYVE